MLPGTRAKYVVGYNILLHKESTTFFPETPLGLGSRLVLQREVRDIGPCLDGRALED